VHLLLDGAGDAEVVFDLDVYDARQTDHAWVHSKAMLIYREEDGVPEGLRPGDTFEELLWQPLDAGTVNSVPSAQAAQIREAVRKLTGEGHMVLERATELLDRTG
jgi:hypothetical protein